MPLNLRVVNDRYVKVPGLNNVCQTFNDILLEIYPSGYDESYETFICNKIKKDYGVDVKDSSMLEPYYFYKDVKSTGFHVSMYIIDTTISDKLIKAVKRIKNLNTLLDA